MITFLEPKTLASWVAVFALFFGPCLPIHGGLRNGDVDFSNYDVPLLDSRTGILKHLPSAGCLTILILIRICAFSMASAAALFRKGTNVLSPLAV
jgi:hypothetical protein